MAEADREYLSDPEGYGSRQARYKRRQEIPKRIRNAFLDLSILASPEFDEELLDEAFRGDGPDYVLEYEEPWRDNETTEMYSMDREMEQAFVDAIAVIGRNLRLGGYCVLIQEATEAIVRRYHPEKSIVDAEYNPTIKMPDRVYERAKWKLEGGEELTDSEVRVLLEHEEVDPETVAEHVRGG